MVLRPGFEPGPRAREARMLSAFREPGYTTGAQRNILQTSLFLYRLCNENSRGDWDTRNWKNHRCEESLQKRGVDACGFK